jgi:transitional endoplasmic reticulum ATPase
LQPFKNLPDFHLGDEIPAQKLANGLEAAYVPGDETISALTDCTFFGSAKDCVLFGERAIYYNNGSVNNFLPYSEFPDTVFFSKSNSEVSCDNAGFITLDGSSFTSDRLTEVLNLIKREAMKRENSVELKEARGLATLPGMSELKQMLQEEVIDPLRDPERFKKYKIEIPNGILMYGPPGCGKTFIAQRLASELNYNFYEVGPSAVASSYIHGSTNMIKKLFDEAARNAPALMFVDEFEGMVPARRSLGGEQQFKAEEVNEWLVQIGSCAQRRILFVAATNEPWSIDDAVQRSGRLDKKVYVGPPDSEALAEMLLHHLNGRPFGSDEDVRQFATSIAGRGYSASDLKLITDEAAKLAIKSHQDISSIHLTKAAIDKVPPSISREQEDAYLAFKEQRKVGV